MPHYKDGTEAKIGDDVVGRGYNVKHEISGVVVGISPGSSTCNVTVAHAEARGSCGVKFPMIATEYGQTDHFERADLHVKRVEAEKALGTLPAA